MVHNTLIVFIVQLSVCLRTKLAFTLRVEVRAIDKAVSTSEWSPGKETLRQFLGTASLVVESGASVVTFWVVIF